jgi:hypothetical protein
MGEKKRVSLRIHSPSEVIRHRLDLSGRRFGRWKVLSYAGSRGIGISAFLCRCDCGTKRTVDGSRLKMGESKSCGCQGNNGRFRKGSTVNLRHGGCRRGRRTPEYISYVEMKKRCRNKNYVHYRHYGGRGIKICKRWLDKFENFLMDMGKRPIGTTLDRIDNGSDYKPSNCRWATHSQQVRNRRKWR